MEVWTEKNSGIEMGRSGSAYFGATFSDFALRFAKEYARLVVNEDWEKLKEIGWASDCASCKQGSEIYYAHLTAYTHLTQVFCMPKAYIGKLFEKAVIYDTTAIDIDDGSGEFAVTGWRAFTLRDNSEGQFYLLGANHKHSGGWKSSREQATCSGIRDLCLDHIKNSVHGPIYIGAGLGRNNIKISSSNSHGCMCGIYGFHTTENMLHRGVTGFNTFAQCTAYGTVAIAEDGFRASDVVLEKLFIVKNMLISGGFSDYVDWTLFSEMLSNKYDGIPVKAVANLNHFKLLTTDQDIEKLWAPQ